MAAYVKPTAIEFKSCYPGDTKITVQISAIAYVEDIPPCNAVKLVFVGGSFVEIFGEYDDVLAQLDM